MCQDRLLPTPIYLIDLDHVFLPYDGIAGSGDKPIATFHGNYIFKWKDSFRNAGGLSASDPAPGAMIPQHA